MKTSQAKYLEMFKGITDEMFETTKRKNSDYTGDDADAFRNFTQVEEQTGGAITTEQGFYTRMSDKWSRFSGFMKNGTLKVADEKIEDTLLDLAVYCILLVCYRRAKNTSRAIGPTTTMPPNFGKMNDGGSGGTSKEYHSPFGGTCI